MPFPAEFDAIRSEAQFLQHFIHPLLRKLGFAVILDYHGTEEFGKDLVFGEIDRFGMVRYHAVQAKYKRLISLTESSRLIEAAKMAFANPFIHPTTGQPEPISGFYALTTGTVSLAARRHFFASLVPLFHQNVFLLDGPTLVQLDRWAGTQRALAAHERVAGVFSELELNERLHDQMQKGLLAPREGRSTLPPVDRLFTTAFGLYQAQPVVLGDPSPTLLYVLAATRVNRLLDTLLAARSPSVRRRLAEEAWEEWGKLPALARAVEEGLARLVERLGPLLTPMEAVIARAGTLGDPPPAPAPAPSHARP